LRLTHNFLFTKISLADIKKILNFIKRGDFDPEKPSVKKLSDVLNSCN